MAKIAKETWFLILAITQGAIDALKAALSVMGRRR